MAGVHDVLLLWFDILGLCLPPLFFVSLLRFDLFKDKDESKTLLLTIIVSFASPCNSMRYSRMLEESSFANRKADYFWLLFLSSLMLLVGHPTSSTLPSHCKLVFYYHPRVYPHSSTSPFSPPRSPTCPSTFGPADIPQRPSRSLVCSPSQHLIFHLPSLHSPGCSLARGALRQAISSDVQSAT
jgi:hypothetical protein